MFYVQHLLILRPGFVHSFKRLSALDRSFTATAVNCAQGAHCREGTGFVQQASKQQLQQHFVQQASKPTRLPNATSIAGSQQSCHLSAQKRPQPLNRSGDKMDYRSFIRALKFQNRTRPSSGGPLCSRCYQNSFWGSSKDKRGIVHRLGRDGGVSGYLLLLLQSHLPNQTNWCTQDQCIGIPKSRPRQRQDLLLLLLLENHLTNQANWCTQWKKGQGSSIKKRRWCGLEFRQ